MATFREVAARLNKASRGEIAAVVSKEMRRASLQAEAKAKINATQRLRVRTGVLRSSITSTVTGTGLDAVLKLSAGGTVAPYARVQELGGIIYPRTAKMLAIPLLPRLEGISPRNLNEPNTFILSARGGGVFIAQSNDSGLTLLYKLVDHVTLRPRYYLRDAFREAIAELRVRLTKALTPLLSKGA